MTALTVDAGAAGAPRWRAMLSRVPTVILAIALAAAPARADTDYFSEAPETSAVKVRRGKSRTPAQRVTIAALLGGAAVAGGIGVWFHLDSRAAADEVSADSDRPVATWTTGHQATYDRIDRSGTKAIVGYSVAGALLAGAIAYAFETRPGEEEVVLEPTREGATVSRVWRW